MPTCAFTTWLVSNSTSYLAHLRCDLRKDEARRCSAARVWTPSVVSVLLLLNWPRVNVLSTWAVLTMWASNNPVPSTLAEDVAAMISEGRRKRSGQTDHTPLSDDGVSRARLLVAGMRRSL